MSFSYEDDVKLYNRISAIIKKAQGGTTPYYKAKCPESGKEIYITPADLVKSKGGLIDCPEGPRKPEKIRPASLADKILRTRKKKKKSKGSKTLRLSKRACRECYQEGAEQGLSENEMDDLIAERHPGTERKRKRKRFFGYDAEKILAETLYPKYDVAHHGYSTPGESEIKNYSPTINDVDPHGGLRDINPPM